MKSRRVIGSILAIRQRVQFGGADVHRGQAFDLTMRDRFRRARQPGMATRPGDGGALTLSPRGLRIAGWLAVIALIALVALAVRLLGGNADGAAVLPSPSASAGGPLAIAFGTELDPATAQVVEASRTERFIAGDTFAYSVAADAQRPDVVYVEVVRVTGDAEQVVQAIADGEQQVPAERPAVAFTVPADTLIAAFGTGTYRMRIFADPDATPIAHGTFELHDPAASAAP
jgi:hypothetical protein